jgi:hypothetical protein
VLPGAAPALHPGQSRVALIGLEYFVAEERQNRAFDPDAQSYPGLVGHPSEAIELAEQWQGSGHVMAEAGKLDAIEKVHPFVEMRGKTPSALSIKSSISTSLSNCR